MLSRIAGFAGIVLVLGAGVAPAAEVPADFGAFLAGFRPEAQAAGISAATLDGAFDGLTPDPSVAALTRRQPEFVKPLGAYLKSQVTAARVAQGRAMLKRWAGPLAQIERRSGVPAATVVAVWGLETNFGGASGSKDVIRSLATLAAVDYRPSLTHAELIAALSMLQSGAVKRSDLKGSWAGAMGQPQFMPSSYLKYAVDGDGDGRRDIWGDIPDALASIANFLKQQGWRPGEGWGFEARRPADFPFDTLRGSNRDWAARGFARADGSALPQVGDSTLFFPAGADGPAFLVTPNYEVIKTYNFSDAYVLSVADLADRMTGHDGISGNWPSEPSMGREDRIALQSRLVELGYPVDNREGRISLALRDTIRAAQARVGQVADGNATRALLTALNTSR